MRKTRTSVGWSLSILFLLLLLGGTAQAAGPNITICEPGGTRDGVYSINNGSLATNLRQKLLNSANYGPSGTSPISFTLVQSFGTTGSITQASLAAAGCEVFYISPYATTAPSVNLLTAAEITALEQWVAVDGGMLLTNSINPDTDNIPVEFNSGYTVTNTGINALPWTASVAGSTHPIYDGPFGTVTSNLTTQGANGYFNSTAGATVISEVNVGGIDQPSVLDVDHGNGHVVFYGDEAVITLQLSAGNGNNTDQDAWALNLFAYAADKYNENNFVLNAPVITSPTNGTVTNDNTPTVSGTADPSITITVTGPGVGQSCSITSDAVTGAWSCMLPALGEGTQTITATATFGSNAPQTDTVSITVDTIAPLAPAILTPTNGAPVEGTAEPGSTVTVTTPSGSSCTAVAQLSDGFWSCTFLLTPINGESITAVATDEVGNASPPTTVVGAIDTVPPVAAVCAVSPNPASSGTSLTATCTGVESGGSVTITDALGDLAYVCGLEFANEVTCTSLAGTPPSGSVDGDRIATTRDSAGNPATSTTIVPFTLDDNAPLAPVITAPTEAAFTNDNTPTVTGTAEVGTTVVVTGPGVETCSALVDGNGDWSCEILPALGEGANQLSAVATDTAGNSSVPATVNITVDTQAPPAPVPDLPTNGAPLTGTGEAGATVNVTTSSGASCVTTVLGDGSWSCNLEPSALLVDGDSITLDQTDAAGNVSSPVTFPTAIDVSNPEPPVFDPVDVNTNPVTGTSEPGAAITITGVVCDNAPVVADVGGIWSCNVTTSSPLVAGSVITATATDEAGNVSGPASATVNNVAGGQSVSPTLNPVANGATAISGTAVAGSVIDLTGKTCSNSPVTADTSGQWRCDTPVPVPVTNDVVSVTATQSGLTPSAPVTTTVYDATVTGVPAPQVDPTNGSVVTGNTVSDGLITVFDDAGMIICSTMANASGAFSCAPLVPPPVDGDELSVVAFLASNPVITSAPTFVTVDQSAPNAPVITAPVNGALTNDNTPTVTGTAEAGVTVTVSGPSGETCSVVADSNGDWSCDLSPPLADGLNQLDATAVDAVGNVSGANSVNITVDVQAPPPPTIDTPTNGDPVTGTGEPGGTVTVTTPGGSSCTAMVQIDGSWSCMLMPAPNNGDDITAVVTDEAGNVSPPTTVVGGIDTSAPAIPTIVSPTDGAVIGDSTPSVTGTAEAGSTVTVVGSVSGTCVTVADVNGDWSCEIMPSLLDGAHRLDATATDSGGNTSGAASVNITVDTVAPAPPSIDTPTTGMPVTGTGEPGGTVTVTTPGGSSCTAMVQVDGSWSCTLMPTPTDGEDLTAVVTDEAGNISPPTTVPGGIDTSAPNPANCVVTPNPANNGTSLTATCTGVETGATVTIPEYLCGPEMSSTVTCTAMAGTSAGLVDGDRIATTTDSGGNSSTSNVSFTLDNDAPLAPSIDTPTNGDPVTGMGEPGATVNVTTPSGSSCTALVQGDGSWSCTLMPTPTDGEDITADQTDPAGNTSPPVTVTGGIDLIAPTPPVIDPVDTGTNPITGTAEPGSTINITGAVCDNAPVAADANGNWSCDVTTSSPLVAGTVITATATDEAGNESGESTATVSDVAGGESVSPTLNPVANGANAISGTAVAGSVIDVAGKTCSNSPVTADASGNWRCDAPNPVPVTNDVVSVTATQTGLTPSAPVTTTVYDSSVTGPAAPQVDPTDGSVVTGSTIPGGVISVLDDTGMLLCTTTADGAGDFSCSPLSPAPGNGDLLTVLVTDANGNDSAPTHVIVDQAAPDAPVITAPTEGTLTNDNTPTVTGTAEVGATVVVTGPGTSTCSALVDGNGDWSCDISPALGEGANQLSAVATDALNNSSTPATVNITVDTIRPPVPVPDFPTTGAPLTGTGEPGATVTVTTDSGAGCMALVQVDGTWSCDLEPSGVLVNGEPVTYFQTDAAGNQSDTEASIGAIDFEPPEPPVINPVDVTTDPITGTSEPDATINITGVVCDNAPVVADAAGNWSCDVTTSSPLLAGSLITATATDVAGNESLPATATVNNVAAGQSVSPTLNPVPNGATQITGTAVAGSVIDLSSIACNNSPVMADSGGLWRCDTPMPVPVTNDVVSATATQSGLTPSAPVTTTVYDAGVTGPQPPLVDPTDGTVVTGSTIPDGFIRVYDDQGVEICSVQADAAGDFSCSPLSPAPVDGDVLSVTVLDPATFRTSPPALVTVDQMAPSAPVITAPVNGALINDDTPTVTGTAEAGVTVNVSGPSGESCSVIADSNGDWSCDITPGLADGSNTLSATATDAVGNTSGADSVTVTVDTSIPPPPVINTPTNGDPVSGTGEVGATVNVTTPSGASCSAMVQLDGSWSCTLSPLPIDGEDITADQTDAVGNTSLPTTVSAGIDLVPPSDPTIVAPTDGALLATNVVSVTGTGEPDSIITVSGPNGEMCSVPVDVAGNWSCVKSPNLQDGVNQLDAIATDAAGNDSNTVSVTITIDTTAPNAPVINTPTNGDPVSGSGEVGAVVTVTTPSGASCTANVQADGSWLCTLVPGPVDGEDITAIQTDAAGNVSDPTTVSGGIDTTVPAEPVITAPVDGAVTNDNTPTVSGTAEAGATVVVTALGGETCMAVADGSGNWSCDIAPELDDGIQALTAQATDPAGNDSTTVSVTITVDTMAPDAPVIITPTNGDPVSGTGEVGATVVVTTPSGATCTTTVQIDGTWSCSLSPAAIDGEDITAVQTDEAGNASDPTTVTGGVDTAAPAEPTITAPAEGSTIMDATPTVTGTAEAGATVVVTGPNNETCNAVADGSGNWSCDLSPALPDGAVQLSAVATDAAGNDSQPATVNFTVASSTTYDVVISPDAELVTTEMGGTATFDVTLSLTPTADVTVDLSISDTTEGTIDTASITFTPGNWNVPVTVTVTGVDDDVYDLDQMYQIVTAAFVSADPNYNGVDPSDVNAVNIDDDENPDLSIFLTNCTADVAPGVSVIYRVIVDNVGNKDINGALVETMLTDLMTEPAWVCESQTGGCAATSGTGDLSETIDLMAGDQVTYVMRGEVTAQLTEFLDSTATVTMPVGETDTNPSNNSAQDSDLTIQYLFKSNFDCDAPGTIQSTTQQLEELLGQYE